MYQSVCLPVCLCVALVSMLTGADQASERSTNTVEVKLYPLSTSEWSGSKASTFQSQVASSASAFCTANSALCGGVTVFSASDVGIVSTEDNSKSMLAQFYVDIPSASTSPFVLSSDTIEVISKSARDSFHSQSDIWMTYIGDLYLGIPPDSTANAVIIPLAVLTVVIVAVVTVALVIWQERKNKAARRQRRHAATRREAELPRDDVIKVKTDQIVVRRERPTRVVSNHGNKVMPNGGAAAQPQERIQMTSVTSPSSKFTEKVEMANLSRNHFQDSPVVQPQREVNYQNRQAENDVPAAHQYHSAETGNTRVVSHTSVVNGQMVDTYTSAPATYTSGSNPPSYSVATAGDEGEREESERRRRKREKRERRAERERERERRKASEERSGYRQME